MLVVCKLDRLARSTRDLLNTLDAVGKAGASFKSLGDGCADTTTPHGRLMLTVLGELAEFERHLILARTSEGRQRAQARGVRLGRKPRLTEHQRQEALERRTRGEALVDREPLNNIEARRWRVMCALVYSPLEHDHKFFPRPLNAIIDCEMTTPTSGVFGDRGQDRGRALGEVRTAPILRRNDTLTV